MAAIAGCGGSDSPEATVIPPVSSTTTTENNIGADPPGAMEMPTSTTVAPTQNPSSNDAKPEGLQMPTNVVPPTPGQSSSPLPAHLRYASWDQIQTEAKSSGRITVVDLWSLSCEPCIKEFPGLVRLQKELGPLVQCISVNLDFAGRKSRPPEHYQDPVAGFLESVGASEITNFICQTPSGDVYAAADVASIPTVLIYAADGQLVRAFVDVGETIGFTYQKDVFPLVEKLAG